MLYTIEYTIDHPYFVIQVNMEPNTALPPKVVSTTPEDDDSDRPKRLLVTDLCNYIGLKLDLIEDFAEPSVGSPAPEGR